MGTNIKQLPESIGDLHNLEKLWMEWALVEWILAAIGRSKRLNYTAAAESHGLMEVPMEIGELTCFERLSLHRAPISTLRSLSKLTCLESLSLHGASISGLTTLPSGLAKLHFSGCSMDSISNLSNLSNSKALFLSDIDMDDIPELPSCRQSVSFCGFQTLSTLLSCSNTEHLNSSYTEDYTKLMEIGALQVVPCLRTLHITNYPKISKLSGLGNYLVGLHLRYCDRPESLLDVSTCTYLTSLEVVECNNIVEIQGLFPIEFLKELYIHDCLSLRRISGFSHLPALQLLEFGNCLKLWDINDLCIDKFTSLENLCLHGGSPALKLLDFSKLRNLVILEVNNFEELKSLHQLSISGCKSLENLSNFSEFTKLRTLDVQGCEKLPKIRGLEKLDAFYGLYIFGCQSLKQLPKLRMQWTIHKEKSEVEPWWW